MNYDDDRLPEGWYMIRVEHPTPIVYMFGAELDPYTWLPAPSSFRFFVKVKDFDRVHGECETNKRKVIRHCIALEFDARMAEPFRIVRDAVHEGDNLLINGSTLARIIIHHSLTKLDHTFGERDFKLFIEQYVIAKNDALAWVNAEARQTIQAEARKAYQWMVRKSQ